MKVIKWIIGLLAGLAGAVTLLSNNKNKQKVKTIKKNLKVSKKKVKEIKTGIEAIEATQKSYEKTLAEMKKEKEDFKPTPMEGKQANKFVKDFIKKRKHGK